MKKCTRCGANLAPLIIAMEPTCNIFQFCPACGTPLGYNIKITVGQEKVLPEAGVDK